MSRRTALVSRKGFTAPLFLLAGEIVGLRTLT